MSGIRDQIEEAKRGIATWPKWMREAAHKMTDEPSVLGAGSNAADRDKDE